MKIKIALIIVFLCLAACTGREPRYCNVGEVKISQAGLGNLPDYAGLVLMDKNSDGMINQLDFAPVGTFPEVYNTIEEVVRAYVEYLNKYQAYDVLYGNQLDKDINKNGKIDEFENEIEKTKICGNLKECFKLLDNSLSSKNISDYQYHAHKVVLYNYMGEYSDAMKTIAELKVKYPESNFSCFKVFGSSSFPVFNFSAKDARCLLFYAADNTVVPYIHNDLNAISLIEKQSARMFPAMFSVPGFMSKLIAKMQVDIFVQEQSSKYKKELNRAFDNLDVLYSFVTGLQPFESFISDKVNEYKTKLKKSQKNISEIKNYAEALSFVKQFLRDNSVPKSEFHFALGAFLGLRISNKKPISENDFLFSPDMLFEKGYGVCSDVSTAFSVFLNELLGVKDSDLYLWFRRAYWNHLDMIYKNVDGRYYILDNYGINQFSFESRQAAVDYHKKLAYSFRKSRTLVFEKAGNESWDMVEKSNKDSITSKDGKISIYFEQAVKDR